jgi:hypothetical protein
MLAAAAAWALACGVALAQADYSTWGIKAGVFLPSSSTLRSIFGDTWLSVGLTPQQSNTSTGNLTFGADIGLIYANSGGNNLTLIPLTFGYTMKFSDPNDAVVPYGAVRAGGAYYDYSISYNSTNYSKSKIDLTGNVEVGIIFQKKFTLAARYDWFAESDHFNFDGLTFWAELQLFRF